MSASSTALQNQSPATMLMQAAEAGDFDAVQALITAGVDVNSANEHGMTALMAAVANGHLAVVSFLLESGADVKAKRTDGFDALALAVFYGHLRIVRELIGRGADPNVNDRLGTSPEVWATVRGFHDIAQVLTDAQTINGAETVAHQTGQSSAPSPELTSAQEPVVKEAFFSDQEFSDETLYQGVTASTSLIAEQPKVSGVEKQPCSVASTYIPKRRHYRKDTSPASVESAYVESTYVPKRRYHHQRKSRELVTWLAYITSDWQRLAVVTLIAMLISGLGTVVVLTLLGLSKVGQPVEPVITTEASRPNNSDFNAQKDLQSHPPAQQMLSKRPESDAATVKPSSKSSERVDGLHSKAAKSSKQKTQADSRPVKSFSSTSVSTKSIPSTNAIGASKENSSGAKAPPHTTLSSPSIKTQRPRRVAGRNDQSSPASTSGTNTKAKVIQWP